MLFCTEAINNLSQAILFEQKNAFSNYLLIFDFLIFYTVSLQPSS